MSFGVGALTLAVYMCLFCSQNDMIYSSDCCWHGRDDDVTRRADYPIEGGGGIPE